MTIYPAGVFSLGREIEPGFRYRLPLPKGFPGRHVRVAVKKDVAGAEGRRSRRVEDVAVRCEDRSLP